MSPSHQKAFLTLEQFQAAHTAVDGAKAHRMVHCVNPFPALPGSEHHRAQNVTFHSMTRARCVAQALAPELQIRFASVTLEKDVRTDHIRFDMTRQLDRSITDLHRFGVERPLPLIFDILDATPADPDDLLIFTNVDITLVPGFYLFLDRVFRSGVDAAVINRRTISNAYRGVEDYALMAGEAGLPHPGFDCFAFRGRMRDAFVRSESCVGIPRVMLAVLYNLLALAEAPVVLLDAHATFHLGNDKQWESDRFLDYYDHNTKELEGVFDTLIADPARRNRFLTRLSGANKRWIFPDFLREKVGLLEPAPIPSGRLRTVARMARHRLRALVADP